METVDNAEVSSGGGTHKIKLGVTFTDQSSPEYKHSLMWEFGPDMATGPQEAALQVTGFLHKKYWKEIESDIQPTHYSQDDGSEIIESKGWTDSPYSPSCVPNPVRKKFRSLFGENLAENTFTFEPDGAPVIDVPSLPGEFEVEVFELEIKVNGRYNEEISEDDSRVEDGNFTSHMREAETGDIIHTSHSVRHAVSWWFTPTETDTGKPRFQIEQCFHKEWDDTVSNGFENQYENETRIEAYKSPTGSPSMVTLPAEIVDSLSEWFGEPLISQSIKDDGGSMPTFVYECFNCERVTKATPRDACPDCDSGSLCTYDSVEEYKQQVENRDEDETELLEVLVNAEPTVKTD
jgi:hypothetical protein